MTSADKIRNRLIDKIIAISNEDILQELDKLISTSGGEKDAVKLTAEQKLMLEMSDRDIEAGRLISQEDLDKGDLEWLNEQ